MFGLYDEYDLAFSMGEATGPTHMCRLAGAKAVLLLPVKSAHLNRKTHDLQVLMAESVAGISFKGGITVVEQSLQN